ncbi:MAG TPA: glycosyltransferase [Vicinamibacterales bacterium]|nr:glycosyltransferase [Vicinamibacterales bacterium]
MQLLEGIKGLFPMVRRARDAYRDVERLQQDNARLFKQYETLVQARLTDSGIGFLQLVHGDRSSADYEPWRHPYLVADNFRRFRDYSKEVWQFALAHAATRETPLRCAFTPNLVQNMYKFADMARRRGALADLYLNDMDEMASSRPEWEEFDGEHHDVFDGPGFLAAHPELQSRVPTYRVPNRPEDNALLEAFRLFCEGRREPLLAMLAEAPGVRYEPLLSYKGFYTYWEFAKALAKYDVIYTANVPFAAYFSGRPYCVCSVGGDLSWDAGRTDDWGRAMTLAFNAARFDFISNPHTIGYCRRLGFTNGVFLPYPMDDRRYSPGPGKTRAEWEATWGKGTYVLTTARLDARDKGFDEHFLAMLASVSRRRRELRFVVVAWGTNAQALREKVDAAGFGAQVIFVLPAGKLRLIDYYRSCDVVLDQLVMGYYGSTALEAAMIGKPVIMKIRREHYEALYDGAVMPVRNVKHVADVERALIDYLDHPETLARDGEAMRRWAVQAHGEERTMPLLLGMLRLAADHVPLPAHLVNPLRAPLTAQETEYHQACLTEPR